jgi:hypothetical protein
MSDSTARSYPTSLRGAGFGQYALRIGSTISLLLIRWDPINVDFDAEDFGADENSATLAPTSATRTSTPNGWTTS